MTAGDLKKISHLDFVARVVCDGPALARHRARVDGGDPAAYASECQRVYRVRTEDPSWRFPMPCCGTVLLLGHHCAMEMFAYQQTAQRTEGAALLCPACLGACDPRALKPVPLARPTKGGA